MVVKDIYVSKFIPVSEVWDNCYFSKEECSPQHRCDTRQLCVE